MTDGPIAGPTDFFACVSISDISLGEGLQCDPLQATSYFHSTHAQRQERRLSLCFVDIPQPRKPLSRSQPLAVAKYLFQVSLFAFNMSSFSSAVNSLNLSNKCCVVHPSPSLLLRRLNFKNSIATSVRGAVRANSTQAIFNVAWHRRCQELLPTCFAFERCAAFSCCATDFSSADTRSTFMEADTINCNNELKCLKQCWILSFYMFEPLTPWSNNGYPTCRYTLAHDTRSFNHMQHLTHIILFQYFGHVSIYNRRKVLFIIQVALKSFKSNMCCTSH